MKLLKSLSSLTLAAVFLLAFSCAQKSSSEGEEAAVETEAETAVETEVAEEAMEMDSTAMEMMDSTMVDSEAIEAVDSASMEN